MMQIFLRFRGHSVDWIMEEILGDAKKLIQEDNTWSLGKIT